MVSTHKLALPELTFAYACAAAATLVFLFSLQRRYVPFDSSNLLFVHYRLPHASSHAVLFGCITLLWFGAFTALVIVLTRNRLPVTRATVAGLIALQLVIGAAFAVMPIAIDSDQYAYAAYAYTSEIGNPYVPRALPNDAPSPQRRIASHWGDPLPPDEYGGAWTAVNAAILAPFTRAPVWVQVLVLRAAALAVAALTTLLIALSSRRGDVGGIAAFALNPLVFLEVANGAHNDIFLVLGGCAAAVCALRERYVFAACSLALASAVKFAYAPFMIPLAALAYRRTQSIKTTTFAVAAFVAIIVLFSAPFGWRHGPLTTPLTLLAHAHGTFRRFYVIVSLGLIAAMASLTVQAARGRLSSRLLVAIALLLLLLPGKIEPWYPLTMTPLLIVPALETRFAFLAISALGVVLAQGSFLGRFPLPEAAAAALVVAAVCAVAFGPRRPGALAT